MDEAKIATRADISETDKWDLTHLFADVGNAGGFCLAAADISKASELEGQSRRVGADAGRSA